MERIVAIYARVSTEHEAQLSALENQIQYYDNILSQHPDWKLYDRYIDEGITGTSVKKRKRFSKMIEEASEGKFDLIITREVSRFARNTVDTLQETRKLRRMGVEVYFTEDNIWTFNQEDGELKLTLMATLAQNESKKTSQRVKAGQKISFENGVFYGTGNILGYNKVGKDMIINEEQAKVVKFIFDSFLKGKGTTEIKYELEKNNIMTATGLKKWSSSTITRILQNPFYCGTIVYRKSYVPDFLEQKCVRNTGQVEKVTVEGTHTPIISKEDFELVQRQIKTHSKNLNLKRKIGVGVPKVIWSKKLICKCGSTFNKAIYHREGETKTYCFRCYNQKNNGSYKVRLKKGLDTEGSCDLHLIPEWHLSLMSNIIFKTIWKDKDMLIDIINNLINETINEKDYYDETEKEIQLCTKKIEDNERKTEKLLDMYLNEQITDKMYVSKKIDIDNNIKSLKRKIEELNNNKGYSKETLNTKLKNIVEEINKNVEYEEKEMSENMIDSFVEYIKVHNDKFDWKLNILKDVNEIDENIFLTRIIVNKDDVNWYKTIQDKFKKIRLKDNLIIDVYI